MDTDSGHSIHAVDNTFDILEALVKYDVATLAELNNVLDVSKSTIYQHLSTLENSGYVEKDGDEYRLGLGFVTLGGYCRDDLDVVKRGRQIVDVVAEETNEFVTLTVRHGFRSMHVYRVEGAEALPTDSYLGVQLDLHATGSGKAVMAHMDEAEIDRYIEEEGLTRITKNTITDPDELREELRETRERGYSTEDNERIEGLRGVAVPVQNRNTGEVIGTIAIAGPVSRLKGDRFREELPDVLKRHAENLEINLTYS